MLFTVRNNAFGENTCENLRIVKKEKFGIINALDNTQIIPEVYDNIFLYGINTFVLYKNGKIGLCRIEEQDLQFNVVMLCECIFDVVDNYNHDLFLSNDTKICYYNSLTQQTWDFKEVNIDTPYIYGCDEEYQYIIHQESGETILKKKYSQYNKSCYLYCGETENGGVFYDASFSTYIYPTANGYKPYEYPLNHPVIMNKYNVINIVDGEKGLGVIDSFGNNIIENRYNAIKIELKITAVTGEEKIEKIVPIPENTFEVGKVSAIENWR